MTNTMRRLALALTLMLCAAIGVDAAGLEEAKGLLGQKKYEEAYAAVEQAVAEKDASVPVLTTGMSAALVSGAWQRQGHHGEWLGEAVPGHAAS